MRKLFIYLFIFVSLFSSIGQTIKELEARRKKAMDELAVTSKMLEQTKRSKQGSVTKIKLLKRQLEQQTAIVNNINKQVSQLERNISATRQEKTSLERKLERSKQEYSKLIYYTYCQQNNLSPYLFILSAKNFQQAIRRLQYLRDFSQFRKNQAIEIEDLKAKITQKEKELVSELSNKEKALNEKAKEAKKLKTIRDSENKTLASLQKREKTLAAQQKEQQRRATELNNRIQKLIAAEIKRDEDKQKKSSSNKSSTSSTAQFELTKEEKILAASFAQNKGKLPWPIEKGYISGKFGVQPHPILKHVTNNNKGTYFQGPAGSEARAIFDGVVTQRFMVPGNNSAIIIKHGNYRTVYSNLTQIYVKEGEKVTTKQKIGKIFVDDVEDNKTELYLMIYNGTTIQNPEQWIAK